MHTLPAASVVGHDFLGNHIGELLIRQPVERNAPPPRTNQTSSSGGIVGAPDANAGRRSSIASQHTASVSSALSKFTHGGSATLALDSFLSVGAITPLGTSTDPIASLAHASQSSSKPSSAGSRSGSADVDVLIHLDHLPLARTRHASEGGSTSPRVGFITSFGAKSRRSAGSRPAPSEAGSSGYFGNPSSRMSTASMSPMEQQPEAITWNLPFRDHHQSFAQAIEQIDTLNPNLSQHSHSSDAASLQHSKPTTSFSSVEEEVATPTTSNGGREARVHSTSTKSQSFSATGSAQPVRQRITRAATESTLDPIGQVQKLVKSPGVSAGPSACGLSHSNSMGAGTSAPRGHRKMPSLIPKGDDERTFCFVESPSSSSEAEMDDAAAVQEPQVATDTSLTSQDAQASLKPAQPTSDHSDSSDSYKHIVEVQYSVHRRASSRAQHTSRTSTSTSSGTSSDAQHQEKQDEQKSTSTTTTPVDRDQDTPLVSLFPFKPFSVAAQNGLSRPARKLRIKPNMQSRPSLLEKTMEDMRRTSRQAQAATANGVPAQTRSPAVTPSASEKAPELAATSKEAGERYDPVAYGSEQRTFRIQSPSSAAQAGAPGFPFAAISSEATNGERKEHPASFARTSDWAREQNRLASSPPANDQGVSRSGYLDLQGSCASLPSAQASLPAPMPLLRNHTASHSSSSTDSPSLLDTRELLSPPETAISTPELESPPLLNKAALGSSSGRRSSPLSS
ncbi:hypothetical protein NDA10_002147 [Ustilago hordei]|nr:hypothetical protein NDA10_002147 [Ustilago hordei]KAJ1583739.1 hypothetical protein NDA15_006376 [Ustilago hordei]KAJ1591768.1 hypothetical protein NDA12_002842 [Ustilago hordei]